MKTSFYFVLWILVYPLLGLFHSPVIDQNAFLIALLAIFGLSYVLRRPLAPMVMYAVQERAVILSEHVYRDDKQWLVGYFRRRFIVSLIGMLYFLVAFIAILLPGFHNIDWIAAAIFGLLLFSYIRNTRMCSAMFEAVRNAGGEGDIPLSQAVSQLLGPGYEYGAYAEARGYHTFEQLLPERPRHYTAYLVAGIVFAVLSALFGLVTVGITLLVAGRGLFFPGVELLTNVSVSILYASLAFYYGVTDLIDCIRSLRNHN